MFIAPFNLIEIFVLIIPFEWWMDKPSYERLNHYVMGVIYSPLLIITAFYESREAERVKFNRLRHEQDDDTTEEWEQMEGEIDFEGEGWDKKVDGTKPNVEVDAAVVELRELKQQIAELRAMLKELKPEAGGSDS